MKDEFDTPYFKSLTSTPIRNRTEEFRLAWKDLCAKEQEIRDQKRAQYEAAHGPLANYSAAGPFLKACMPNVIGPRAAMVSRMAEKLFRVAVGIGEGEGNLEEDLLDIAIIAKLCAIVGTERDT